MLATATLLALALPVQETVSADHEALFALLDSFDPLDTSTLRFVRIATGRWHRVGSAPRENTYKLGFRLQRRRGAFTVRYLDLSTATLRETPAETPEHARVGCEPADFAREARRFAKALAAERKREHGTRYYMRPEAPMPPEAVAVAFARAADRRGLTAERDALLGAAGSLQHARDRLARGLHSHLAIAFTDPGLGWPELLAMHERWLEAFPNHYLRSTLAARVEQLERAVKAGVLTIGPESSAAELVRALRDEFHPVSVEPSFGMHDLPARARRPESGTRPTERLVKLGLRAVPALIEALDEEGLTRRVWYSSRFGGAFDVHSVGAVAREILSAISGLQIHGRPGDARAKWKEWYASAETKGEEAALLERVQRADAQSFGAARRLLERWPARLPDVIRAIENARQDQFRTQLLYVIIKKKDRAVTDFLLRELGRAPNANARAYAAQQLLERGRRDGIAKLLAAWRRERDGSYGSFLVGCGDPDAVRAVMDALGELRGRHRHLVIKALRGGREHLLRYATGTDRAAIDKLLEDLLGRLLDDRTPHGGWHGFQFLGEPAHIAHPTTADFAACGLAEGWPDHYTFDPNGPARLRERLLARMRNVWRKRRGLAPLASDAAPDVRSRDREIARRLAAIAAGNGELTAHVTALEKHGLGALAAIDDAYRGLPAKHDARSELEKLAGRLANLVRAVELSADGLPTAYRTKVLAMEGKPLVPGRLIELVTQGIAACPDACGRVGLIADRIGDRTGILIRMTVEPIAKLKGNSATCNYRVEAGGRSVGNSQGGGVRSAYDGPEDYRGLCENIADALREPPGKTFEIVLNLTVR